MKSHQSIVKLYYLHNCLSEKFKELLMDAKIQISQNLANEIMNQFLVTKKSLDLVALKESYRSYFPNTELPTPPPPKTKIIDKLDIEKKKKKKVLQKKKKVR